MRTSTREPGIIIEVRTGQSRASRRTHGTKTPPRVDVISEQCIITVYIVRKLLPRLINTQIRTYVHIGFVFAYDQL